MQIFMGLILEQKKKKKKLNPVDLDEQNIDLDPYSVLINDKYNGLENINKK